MWVKITSIEYAKLFNRTLYKAMAGGIMLNGGHYTEYCPNSDFTYPDLRAETNPGEDNKYYVFAGSDPRD
jgi:hypothetical protein